MTRRTALAIALAATGSAIGVQALGDAADTMHLTDEPGNWFRSDATGTPLAVIETGQRVDFKIGNCCTNTRHTVVGIVDFLIVLGNWGPCFGCPADLDCDGAVGITDFLMILGLWS